MIVCEVLCIEKKKENMNKYWYFTFRRQYLPLFRELFTDDYFLKNIFKGFALNEVHMTFSLLFLFWKIAL